MNLSFAASIFAASVEAPIPTPDPLGFPVPAVLIQALAYFTLTLHFLAVNFTLGSLLLLIWSGVRKGPGHGETGRFLGSGLPLGFSYLVTLGVPPLLFVQVLYGQMFYSSSVLIGAFWIMVVPLLITAYGLLYLHKMTRDKRPKPQLLYLLVALASMLFIGFIYVNNITLSFSPDRWIEMYAAHPGGGNLNTAEPTLWPRYLLFISPAFTVAGLALVLAGALLRRWRGDEQGAPMSALGLKSFVLGRVFTAGAAAALIATLPDAIREQVLSGGGETIHLAAGIGLAVVATIIGVLAARRGSVRLSVLAFVVMAVEVASFVVLRDRVRLDYLADHFALSDVPMNHQWGMFSIFAAALLVGLTFLIVMTYKVVTRAIEGAREDWEAKKVQG